MLHTLLLAILLSFYSLLNLSPACNAHTNVYNTIFLVGLAITYLFLYSICLTRGALNQKTKNQKGQKGSTW
jgi:hypothetical protein